MEKIHVDKEKIFKWVVLVYFIISPIFDIIYLYNHITTLFRVAALLLFVLIIIIMYKDSRKKFVFLLAYYLAMLLYLVIDYFCARGFTSLVPGNFDYSVISEAMTLLKLCMPFTILFILKFLDVSKREFLIVINSWILIVAGSIVVLNLFGHSLSSYTDLFTSYSIFSWGHIHDYVLTATKGLFAYANQAGILLLMLLVLSVYETLFIKKRYIVYVFLIVLACLMLGSRVSTYGGLVSLIGLVVVYIAYIIFFKKKFSYMTIGLVLISVFWIMMLPISPNSGRMKQMEDSTSYLVDTKNENVVEKVEDNKKEDEKSKESIEDVLSLKMKYIEDNFNSNIFSEEFYKTYYPYQYDTEFWVDIVSRKKEVQNYRTLETEIIRRVKDIDGRSLTTWFGVSNSRIQNIVNIERDFVLHYYAFGIVGTLLCLSFYLYSLIKVGLSVIKSRDFLDVTILSSLALFMFASYLSGNSLNFLAATVPCAFIVSFSLKYKDC